MHPDAERISNYLDGELDAQARASVEQLLLDDPAARELFGELRRLRGDLQGLPKHSLPGQFADDVMRAAERLMLLGPGEPATEMSVADAQEWTAQAPQVAARNLWRSPAWFISGAAAAVLLMLVFGPWRGGSEPTVATGPTDPVGGATAPEKSEDRVPTIGSKEDRVPTIEPPPTVASDQAAAGEEPAGDGPADNNPPRVAGTNPKVAPSASTVPDAAESEASVLKQAPFGMVVWSDVTAEAIEQSHFDKLLRQHRIQVSGSAQERTSVEDVIYVEATPEQLSAVYMRMCEQTTFYRSAMMQSSLGVFRDPEMWSEILDLAKPSLEAENPEVSATVYEEGTRAAHITPDVIPARPLKVDEANFEMLAALEKAFAPGAAADPGPNEKPTVDNGLVRVLFILRPLPPTVAPATAP